jgi:hypothetical protein
VHPPLHPASVLVSSIPACPCSQIPSPCSSLFTSPLSLFIPVCPCSQVSSPCSSLFVPVHLCSSLFIPIHKFPVLHPCSSVFTSALSLFIPVRPCSQVPCSSSLFVPVHKCMCIRLTTTHIYNTYVQYFRQGNHQLYCHTRFWLTLCVRRI